MTDLNGMSVAEILDAAAKGSRPWLPRPCAVESGERAREKLCGWTGLVQEAGLPAAGSGIADQAFGRNGRVERNATPF